MWCHRVRASRCDITSWVTVFTHTWRTRGVNFKDKTKAYSRRSGVQCMLLCGCVAQIGNEVLTEGGVQISCKIMRCAHEKRLGVVPIAIFIYIPWYNKIWTLRTDVVQEQANVLHWVLTQCCEYDFDCDDLRLCIRDVRPLRQRVPYARMWVQCSVDMIGVFRSVIKCLTDGIE